VWTFGISFIVVCSLKHKGVVMDSGAIFVLGLFLCILLFSGEPDIADAIIHFLMK
jgi:hypothetical protein